MAARRRSNSLPRSARKPHPQNWECGSFVVSLKPAVSFVQLPNILLVDGVIKAALRHETCSRPKQPRRQFTLTSHENPQYFVPKVRSWLSLSRSPRWWDAASIMVRMLVADDAAQLVRAVILQRGLARQIGDRNHPTKPGFGSILPRRYHPVGTVERAGHDLDLGAVDTAEN